MAVPKRLRYEILRRDNHSCKYCGATAPDVILTVDHVVPVALGGIDAPENLVAACKDCNAGKSASSASDRVVQDVDQDAVRWSMAMARVRDRAQQERSKHLKVTDWIGQCWDESAPQWADQPAGWEASVIQFSKLGLTVADLTDAVHKAIGSAVPRRNMWRYFCGTAWGMIRDREKAAAELLRAEEQRPELRNGQLEYAMIQGATLAAVCDGGDVGKASEFFERYEERAG